MNRLFHFFASISLLLLLVTSCLNGDDIVLSDDAGITSFYINDQQNSEGLSAIRFIITDTVDVSGRYNIYNPTPIPFGMLLDSFNVKLTVSGGSLKVKTDGGFINASVDTIKLAKSDYYTFFQTIPYSGNLNKLREYRLTVAYVENDPDSMVWSKMPGSLPFDTKGYVASQVVNGKLWVLKGDTSGGTIVNQLYTSIDGTSWSNVTINGATFPVGIYHSLVAFKDKLYCVGYLARQANGVYVAKDEVWSSTDGVVWAKEAGFDFENSIFKSVAVYHNKIYAIGGTAIVNQQTDLNKAIHTSGTQIPTACRSIFTFDGTTWTKSAAIIPSTMPARFGQFGVSNANMYCVSGENGDGLTGDVWATENGSYWIRTKQDAVVAIENSTMISYDNNLLLIGGKTEPSWAITYQKLFSDGAVWSQKTINGFTPRNNAAVVTNGNKIFIVGGNAVSSSDGVISSTNYLKEVWVGSKLKYME